MQPWVGFDLDGTLAVYKNGQPPVVVGPPIAPTVALARKYLESGMTVKIFTARATDPNPKVKPAIEAWCKQHLGQVVEITASKDYAMLAFYDDRAIAVEPNTGRMRHF